MAKMRTSNALLTFPEGTIEISLLRLIKRQNVQPVTKVGDGADRRFSLGTKWYIGSFSGFANETYDIDATDSGTLTLTRPGGTAETYDVILQQVEDTFNFDTGGDVAVRGTFIGRRITS